MTLYLNHIGVVSNKLIMYSLNVTIDANSMMNLSHSDLLSAHDLRP
jgi:hypothetical protein